MDNRIGKPACFSSCVFIVVARPIPGIKVCIWIVKVGGPAMCIEHHQTNGIGWHQLIEEGPDSDTYGLRRLSPVKVEPTIHALNGFQPDADMGDNSLDHRSHIIEGHGIEKAADVRTQQVSRSAGELVVAGGDVRESAHRGSIEIPDFAIRLRRPVLQPLPTTDFFGAATAGEMPCLEHPTERFHTQLTFITIRRLQPLVEDTQAFLRTGLCAAEMQLIKNLELTTRVVADAPFGIGRAEPAQQGGCAFERLFPKHQLFQGPDDVTAAVFDVAQLIECEAAEHAPRWSS